MLTCIIASTRNREKKRERERVIRKTNLDFFVVRSLNCIINKQLLHKQSQAKLNLKILDECTRHKNVFNWGCKYISSAYYYSINKFVASVIINTIIYGKLNQSNLMRFSLFIRFWRRWNGK